MSAPSPRQALPWVLAGLAASGLAVSVYLTAAHWGDKPIVCAGLGQCDFVNSSAYATVGGVPVSLLGAAVYLAMLGAAVLWSLDRGDERWPILFWGLALAGAGYAGYLTYIELAVLRAICVWCVVSATILGLSLVLATAGVLSGEEPSAEPADA